MDRARRYRSSPFAAKSLNNSEAFASSHQPNLEYLDTTPLTPPGLDSRLSPWRETGKNLVMKFSLSTIAMLVMCGLCFGSQPRPRENDLFKMEVAGFVVNRSASGPQLKYIFGFATKKPAQITHVKVEDITEKQPIVLVDDKEPKIERIAGVDTQQLRPSLRKKRRGCSTIEQPK